LAATSTLEFSQALETLLAVSKQTDQSVAGAAVTVAKFAAVEDAAAVDAAALAEVFKRAGTTLAQNFGPNLDTAIGLIAAVAERSRQSASVVGTFFKTLGARLSGANSEAVAGLKTLNISLEDSNGNLKNLSVLLNEVAEATRGLGAEDLGNILGKLGGVRQAELFKVALESVRGGRAEELEAAASKGLATQTRKAAEEGKKFESSMNKLRQTFNDLVNDLKNGPLPGLIHDLAETIESIAKFMKDLNFSNLGGIGASVLGGGVLNQLTGGGLTAFGASGPDRQERQKQALRQKRLKLVERGRARQARALGRSTNLLSRFSGGLRGVNNALPAFSARAIGASLVLGAASNAMEDSSNTFVSEVGKVGGTFASLLPFGPKIAALGVAVDQTTIFVKDLWTANQALNGSMQDTAKLFEEGNLVTPADADAASNIRRRIAEEQFTTGIGPDNNAQADLLAGKFSAIVEEAARNLEPDNPELHAKARELIQEFIGSLDAQTGEFANLDTLKDINEFVDKLDGDLKQAFQISDPQAFATLSEAIQAAASRLAVFRDAMTPFTDNLAAISKTQLENELKLIQARSKSEQSIAAVFNAEEQLFQARIDASSASQIATSLKLEEELAQTRIDAINRANDAIEAREKRKQERILKGAEELQKRQEALIARNKADPGRTGVQAEGLDTELQALQKAFSDNEAVIRRAQRALENRNVTENDYNKINDNLVEIRKIELNLIKQEMQARARLNEARRADIARNVSNSVALATASQNEARAREKLAAAASNRRDPVKDVEEVTAAAQRGLEIRLAGLKSEIQLLQELEATALEARRSEQESIISRLGATRTGDPSKDADVDAGIARAKAVIDSISKLQVKNGKRVQALLFKQAQLESKIRVNAIDGLRKRLEAARKVEKERLAAAGKLLDVAKRLKESVKSIFEAQKSLTDSIRAKVDEAAKNIKSKRGALGSAFDELASAREALLNASGDAADAFAEFNLEVAKAAVAADKILGKFAGIRQQASALNQAFAQTIDAAAAAGASEEKLADLRKQAAEEQLSLFQQLLSDTRSKAESFFVSSAEDRQGFVQGLAALQSVGGQFGGNIENFRGLDEGALNDLGRSLISLPQEVRQNMIQALDQLPDGVSIAGLTSDEIREVLQGAALGESEEVGIERLSDTIQTVADLTRQVAELNTSQLIAAQSNLAELQAGVAEAREQVLIAKNALAQAKIDAAKTQSAIRDVVRTLNSQIAELRDSARQDAQQIIATSKTAAERQARLLELLANTQSDMAKKISGTASLVDNVTPDSTVARQRASLPGSINGPGTAGREIIDNISRGIADANKELRTEIAGLTTVLNGNFADNITRNIEALESLSSQMRASATQAVQDVQAELNIDNTQQINISGATEVVDAVLRALEAKEFVTEQDLREIHKILAKIIEDQINAGVSRPNRAIGV
jgi:hypothetical protein